MIEQNFDIAFVANLARQEKQIQQNYRPVIAVHKWFARRPGTLFRALLLSEFSDLALKDAFYRAGDLSGKTVADPFMGGGTPLLEANRLGADICGCDINPMAWWIVRQEIEHLDLAEYRKAADSLRSELEAEIGHLYRTYCQCCGSPEAHVKYFLWLKTMDCHSCGRNIELFPGYLVAENVRHPQNVFVCASCGQLTEIADRKKPGNCSHCHKPLGASEPAKRNKCRCGHCGAMNKYPNGHGKPFEHKLFAIEYYCPTCKPFHKGRFFKAPDAGDLAKIQEAESRLAKIESCFIPDDAIPAGDETNRLHRWGYKYYRELFNARQLVGLEASSRIIVGQADERVRNALSTNFSDLLRYQNMLCRYDTMALKSLDIFSVHGFPVGLVQCESNFLGIENGSKLPAGSGGWLNIIEKYFKAKAYCDTPFEVRQHGTVKNGRKTIVFIKEEWIGDTRPGAKTRIVDLACTDAASRIWPPNSLDAVFTDPPYFGNVQYAELMDFCYIWLRRLVGENVPFKALSTRTPQELTGNETMGRGLIHFTEGLASAYAAIAAALKPRAPFAFTYHHNDITAYFPIAVAILDADLVCTKVLPCPAEMGASIHISGTASSTVDSVFVCRRKIDMPTPESADIEDALHKDLTALYEGGLKITLGDIRCVLFGHIIREAINSLAPVWNKADVTATKLAALEQCFKSFGAVAMVQTFVENAAREVAVNMTKKKITLFSQLESDHAAAVSI
jgi:adenine-specific DNA methylase